MNSRRKFLKNSILGSGLLFMPHPILYHNTLEISEDPLHHLSDFSKRLKPIGRILELEGYYVWCNTPIYDEKGNVHVFFSRWEEKYGMSGWIHQSEIAHAVSLSPESKFEVLDVAIAPRPGFFDATTCHNPHIQFRDGKYYLFFMGNSNGKTNTKRIGLAVSESLYGPWERARKPLLDVGPEGSWDDHCTTNPAYVNHPNGESWLYYKSWNSEEYDAAPKETRIKGNRKYGLAIADNIEGPYTKYPNNPVIDFSKGNLNEQLEDAYVWHENGKFKLIARDMGFFNHDVGLYFESVDGIHWPKPQIAYLGMEHYFTEPPAPSHLKRYGRIERPQLLIKDGKPDYLFGTSQGGKYQTASGVLFKIAQ